MRKNVTENESRALKNSARISLLWIKFDKHLLQHSTFSFSMSSSMAFGRLLDHIWMKMPLIQTLNIC
jgi:hypothetical protein